VPSAESLKLANVPVAEKIIRILGAKLALAA
jgi:hypothetical protein